MKRNDSSKRRLKRSSRDGRANEARSGDKLESLSEGLYQSLKRDILRCKVAPGALIGESALARQYQVSRTPVREALRRLMQDGLVSLTPSVGYTVTPVTVRDVHEVYSLRFVLEGEAAELATPRISSTSIERLEHLLTELLDLKTEDVDDTDRWRYLVGNTEFHMIVAKASGNRRLTKMIETLLEEASRYVYLESVSVGRKGVDESLKVLEAMRTGDPLAARRAMQVHIRATHRRAVDAIVAGVTSGVSPGYSSLVEEGLAREGE